ncbi:ABC transporter permease [Pseudonocardia endophytica]|uniref:NitT/TauT family transport system permease protein n=1 Tax=Pseudonocardia endophytica TaxID=401976 RepID=A0A4R1HHX7_PSEEN|nr:ABC transporter permease [Pseudonocardia endophytica]TCK21837.1 NitT/TauT family transport system permease protein [Pseudonocardia endophytica]
MTRSDTRDADLSTPDGVLPATAFDRRPTFLARNRDVLLGLVGGFVVLAVWQATVWAGWVDPAFSGSPLGALGGLGHLYESGNLVAPTLDTLRSVGLGLLISMAAGIPLGLVIGRSVVLHGLLEPLIGIMYSVPFVVFLPIIIFWFGIDDSARLVIVVWSAIFPLMINVVSGARNLDASYLQVSRSFCAGRVRTLWSVALPGTMPYILAGLRQAVGRTLVGAIVAELFMGTSGLGYVVQAETSNFEMDNAMAAIGVIAVVAVVLTRGVAWLENRLTFWSGSVG